MGRSQVLYNRTTGRLRAGRGSRGRGGRGTNLTDHQPPPAPVIPAQREISNDSLYQSNPEAEAEALLQIVKVTREPEVDTTPGLFEYPDDFTDLVAAIRKMPRSKLFGIPQDLLEPIYGVERPDSEALPIDTQDTIVDTANDSTHVTLRSDLAQENHPLGGVTHTASLDQVELETDVIDCTDMTVGTQPDVVCLGTKDEDDDDEGLDDWLDSVIS